MKFFSSCAVIPCLMIFVESFRQVIRSCICYVCTAHVMDVSVKLIESVPFSRMQLCCKPRNSAKLNTKCAKNRAPDSMSVEPQLPLVRSTYRLTSFVHVVITAAALCFLSSAIEVAATAASAAVTTKISGSSGNEEAGISLNLDGSRGSYARLSAWVQCILTSSSVGGNGSTASTLSFEFQTRRQNALVLYADGDFSTSATTTRLSSFTFPAGKPAYGNTAAAGSAGREAELRRWSMLFSSPSFWFVELRMVRGILRLRAAGGVTLAAGSGLDDGRPHSVAITRSSDQISLTVDRSTHSAAVPVQRHQQPQQQQVGILSTLPETEFFALYIGGVPPEFATSGDQLVRLAVPSSAFEPRFDGWVRRLTYTTRCSAIKTGSAPLSDSAAVRVLSSSGLRTNDDDSCSDYDPCQNGASCASTDSGPVCDCTSVEYTGPFCDREKSPTVVTLHGQEYMNFDLSTRGGEPITGNSETISLYFKTTHSNGLLFYAGDGDNHVLAALRDDAVVVRVKLKSGVYETEIRPTSAHASSGQPQLSSSSAASMATSGGTLTTSRFDDDRWHKLLINREARELVAHRGICYVTVQVDDDLTKTGTTVGDFTMLSSRVMYVGGTLGHASMFSTGVSSVMADNFRGCLKQVVYRSDGVVLDIVSLAQGRLLFDPTGSVTFGSQCAADSSPTLALPVSFNTEQSVIELPPWQPTTSGSRSLRFQMTTVEPTGLIVYSFGQSGTTDFFGIEMVEGYLYIVIDLGSGPLKIKASHYRLDDSRVHQVSMAVDGVHVSVRVDDRERRYAVGLPAAAAGAETVPNGGGGSGPPTTDLHRLDLAGSVYLGGMGMKRDSRISEDHPTFPSELWTAAWRRGYVGCIRDLSMNGQRIDTAGLGREQEVVGLVEHCRRTTLRGASATGAAAAAAGGTSSGLSAPAVLSHCSSHPCLHNGRCRDGWNRFVCDCSMTGYRGAVCRMPARTVTFNGSIQQHVIVALPDDGAGTEVSDISVRFRTRYPNGHLLTTSSHSSADLVTVALIAGRIRVEIGPWSSLTSATSPGVSTTGGASAEPKAALTGGQSLDDDRWHTVTLKRRAQLVELGVDNATKVELTGRSRLFSMTSVVVGGTGNNMATSSRIPKNADRTRRGLLARSVSPTIRRSHRDVIGQKAISGRDAQPPTVANNISAAGQYARAFNGKMQQLVVNGHEVFEMLRVGTNDGSASGSRKRPSGEGVEATFIGGTVEPTTGPFPAGTALTFKSADAYTVLRMRIHSTFEIYFMLKTTKSDGLILYSGGERDFLAIELVDGLVHYVYDVGAGPRTVRVQTRHPVVVSDNRWHSVAIRRRTLTQQELRVDDASSTDILTRDPSDVTDQRSPVPSGNPISSSGVALPPMTPVHFDVTDRLYIGGAPRAVFAGSAGGRHLRSRDGFQGCLAGFDLDGEGRPLLDQGATIPHEYADLVVPGCAGPMEECSADTCDNGGRCVQEWTSYTCDCDMTSYTGPTCSDESVGFIFGSERPGFITFTFPETERIDSRHDQLAFGISTTYKEKAVIVHVTSGNTNDYISIEMIDGNIVAQYNMGMMDHVVGIQSQRVNDGKYHVVRFWRNGTNSTIKVDDWPAVHKHPTGRQLTTFNNEAQVFVAGKKDSMDKWIWPFRGTIAGLVLNGQKLLDLAAESPAYDRVQLEGGVVQAVRQPSTHLRRRTTLKPTTKPTTTSRRVEFRIPTTLPPSIYEKQLPARGAGASGTSRTSSGCQNTEYGVVCSQPNFPDAFNVGPSNNQNNPVRKPGTSDGSHQPTMPCAGSVGDPSRAADDCAAADGVALPSPNDPASTAPIAGNPLGLNSTLAHNRAIKNAESSSLVQQSASAVPSRTPSTRRSIEQMTRSPTTAAAASGGVSGSTPRSSSSSAGAKSSVAAASGGSLATSIGLIVGCVVGIVLLTLGLAFGVYKYRSRDEGVYRIDDVKNYFSPAGVSGSGRSSSGTANGGGTLTGNSSAGYEACNSKPLVHLDGGSVERSKSKSRSRSSSSVSGQSTAMAGRTKRKENREWYV